MIDEDDDQKNAPPPINRFSGTISFSRRKMQSRNLEQVRKMSVDKRPKRPKKNPSKESRLEDMLKKTKRIKMIGRILFLLIPILGAIAMWYFYQDAF